MLLPRAKSWLTSLATGAAIVAIFGATCAHAAHNGGPAWMAGQEMEIFLKLSAITASLVIADICWMIRPARADGAIVLQLDRQGIVTADRQRSA